MLDFICTLIGQQERIGPFKVPQELSQDIANDMQNGDFESLYDAALGETTRWAHKQLSGATAPEVKVELEATHMNQTKGWLVAEFFPTPNGVETVIKVNLGSPEWDHILSEISE